MESKGLIEAIRGVSEEELGPIHGGISKVKDRLTALEIKEQTTHERLDDPTLDIKVAERDTRRGIAQANDAIGTPTAVLEAKDILPRAL